MSEATKPNYKQTLNLPRTDFAMKANLTQNEPHSIKRWQEQRLYDEILAVRQDLPLFSFHDGPPYANGNIHLGHLLNKVLKDLIVRTRNLMGRRCPYVPGWDCHGLPIEHKVVMDLIESKKIDKINSLSDDQRRMAIRRECARYAEKYVKLQATQMQRLLTLADYEHPYLTMSPEYERGVIEVLASLIEQGLVYRALKPVHWSIANQTALAEAELEYEDRVDPSIYVDFEADDRQAVGKAFGVELEQTPSFMIWTTTPWTLPANLAIAVHPRYRYALAFIDGNVTVIASDLLHKVAKAAKAEKIEVLGECEGSALVGLRYRHPFCDDSILGEPRRIVAADYVTLEDGTGLVHTAPGHGVEDYQTGQREGLPIYCPVKADGTYDATVPDWLRDMLVWDANAAIVDHLRALGNLFFEHKFTHSYPHDWRSKTPVIFLCTEQWFVAVDQATKTHSKSLREMALNAAQKQVQFTPEWGRNRMVGMLESRPDWCISRQRSWGISIPAFQLTDGSVFMTAASTRAIAAVFAKRGSDAWFTETPAGLLADYNPAADPDAPRGLDVSKLTKMHDILDVWFESGSSWKSVMEQRDLGYPADLYCEGSDQHRGWFQSSLLLSLGVTGSPPFRGLVTHGFTVDKDGRKMSKSEGNTIEVEDLLKSFGADVCRWWVSSLAYENDIKADASFFEVAGESYRKVRNTLRFLLSNLADFAPDSGGTGVSPVPHGRDARATDARATGSEGKRVDLKSIKPTSLDGYILQEAAKLHAEVTKAYEEYEFRRAHQALYDFCNDALSAFYCFAMKDRLYCDRPDSPRRRTTQTVMWELTELLCRLLAPILPHSADEAWRALWKDSNSKACVHLEVLKPLTFTADPDWPRLMAERDQWLKAIEDARQSLGIDNPLDCGLRVPRGEGWLAKFDRTDLADMCGISRFELTDDVKQPTVIDLRSEPRCERSWKRDGTVRQRSDGGMLSDRDAEAVGV